MRRQQDIRCIIVGETKSRTIAGVLCRYSQGLGKNQWTPDHRPVGRLAGTDGPLPRLSYRLQGAHATGRRHLRVDTPTLARSAS